jgi:hypothetical protein
MRNTNEIVVSEREIAMSLEVLRRECEKNITKIQKVWNMKGSSGFNCFRLRSFANSCETYNSCRSYTRTNRPTLLYCICVSKKSYGTKNSLLQSPVRIDGVPGIILSGSLMMTARSINVTMNHFQIVFKFSSRWLPLRNYPPNVITEKIVFPAAAIGLLVL